MRRHEVREALDLRLPAGRQLAARNFDLLAEVLPG
jgi:hypothetical protein